MLGKSASHGKRAATWAVIAGAACAAVAIALWPRWTADDAFITFRYAENLAHHGQFAWNLGQDPVEGYTGVVLPAALAAAVWAGLSPLAASKAIGIAAFFASGFLLFVLLRRWGVGNIAAAVAAVLWFAAPMMFTHAWSGLETTLFAAVVAMSLWALLRAADATAAGRRRAAAEGLFFACLLACPLVRPEGAALSVLLAAGYLAALRWGAKPPVALGPTVVRALLVAGLPALAYWVWRWQYYGHLLPNTFAAKSAEPGLHLSSGKFLVEFAAGYLALPFAAALALMGRGRPADRRLHTPAPARLILLGVSAGFVVMVMATYLRVQLIMNYSHRFFVPMYVIGLLWLGVMLDRGLAARAAGRVSWAAPGLAAALVLAQVALLGIQAEREWAASAQSLARLRHQSLPAARFVRQVVPQDEWLAVCIDAGAVPYYSRLKTLDLGRLNDEYLARHARTPAQVADHFFDLAPAAVVATSWRWGRLTHGPPTPWIANDERFHRYRLARRFRAPGEDRYFQFVYLREDLLLAGQ